MAMLRSVALESVQCVDSDKHNVSSYSCSLSDLDMKKKPELSRNAGLCTQMVFRTATIHISHPLLESRQSSIPQPAYPSVLA